GPFHRTSTLKSRSAARTPACTDIKKRCDVALGTTPISFLVRCWQEPSVRSARHSTSKDRRLGNMAQAQYTLPHEDESSMADSRTPAGVGKAVGFSME